MAKTREQAIANYERGSQYGAERYNSAKGRMASNWAAGLQSLGVTPSAARMAKYQQAVSQAQYRAGNGQKWFENWVRGLSS